MKMIAVLCFVVGAVFLLLTALWVITRGWRPLDVSALDVYFVVRPSYLLLIAGSFTCAGWLAAFIHDP